MERYLAICHPLYAYKMAGIKRALYILAVIWCVALLSAIPYAISMSIVYPGVYPEEAGLHLVNQTILESAFCIITNHYFDSRNLMETATFIFFIIPMLILSFLYVRIGVRILRTSLGRGKNALSGTINQQKGSANSSRRNALRMLGITITFLEYLNG